VSYPRLFGTDGVRGVVNEFLTPENVLRLTLAIASYFGSGSRIIVGRDARAGNDFITHIVIGGLLASGVKVYYAGLTPTPALQYYIKSTGGFDGGIMITASHNPPQYSGIKVIASDGVELHREGEKEIEKIYHEGRFRRVPWKQLSSDYVKVDDVNEHYIRGVVGLVDIDKIRSRNFRVVLDGANNVPSLTSPKILKHLGVKLITVNTELSHVPNREPEPTPENLVYTSSAVRSMKADFGVAHDGDGDRAIFIDGKGRVLSGDRTAILLCKHIIEYRRDEGPKRVVTAVSSSTLVEEVLSKYGVEIVWTRVGSITIARTMMKIGAIAGFEENGGFMYPPHQYVRDGGIAIALMLEYLSYIRKSLTELIDELPSRHIVKTKVPIRNREEAAKVINKLKELYSKSRIIDIDGVKIIERDYWILVRPSGTEPILRVFVEASNEQQANSILNSVLKFIKEVLGH